MSEVEHSESYDQYQGQLMHGTLSGGCLIRQTMAKSYACSNKTWKEKGGKELEYFVDEATLPRIGRPTRPLSPLIVTFNHQTRREGSPHLSGL